MVKIQKINNSLEGGNRSYFLAICDFASLQARLATIDSCLNENGIDPVLYEVYRDNSKTSDLHSMTGFNTFSKGRKAIEVFDDSTGENFVFDELSKVKIKRDNEEVVVYASELKSTDSIIEHL